MLNEAVIKNNNTEIVTGALYATAVKMLLVSIKNNRLIIDLPLTRIDSLSYLARVSDHEELKNMIETATMSKDFQERNKTQKQLKNKLPPLYNWLKENIFNFINGRKPKVTRMPDKQFVIEYKTNNPEVPYLKFVRFGEGFKLVAFHDSIYSLKKKSFSDTNSFKFGSKELKKRLQKINEELFSKLNKLV